MMADRKRLLSMFVAALMLLSTVFTGIAPAFADEGAESAIELPEIGDADPAEEPETVEAP